MNKKLIFYGKIILSFLILYFIFRKIDLVKTYQYFTELSSMTLFLLLLTTFIKFYTQYSNWKSNLCINPKYKPNTIEILKSHFIGIALRFLVPGGHATFAKVFYVNNSSKKATFISIWIEKFFQSWIILFYASWAAVFFYKQFNQLLLLALAFLITLIPFILLIMPNKFKKYDFTEYWSAYRKHFISIIVMQIGFVFLTFYQYHIIVNEFHAISFLNTSMLVALILCSNLIPITYGGLGLRETFSAYYFTKLGVPGEIAVSASLTIFFFNSILPALPGLYYIIADKKRKPDSP